VLRFISLRNGDAYFLRFLGGLERQFQRQDAVEKFGLDFRGLDVGRKLKTPLESLFALPVRDADAFERQFAGLI